MIGDHRPPFKLFFVGEFACEKPEVWVVNSVESSDHNFFFFHLCNARDSLSSFKDSAY